MLSIIPLLSILLAACNFLLRIKVEQAHLCDVFTLSLNIADNLIGFLEKKHFFSSRLIIVKIKFFV